MSRIIRPMTEPLRQPKYKPARVGEVPLAVCQDTDIAPGIDPSQLQAPNGQLNVGPILATLNQHSVMLHAALREICVLREALEKSLRAKDRDHHAAFADELEERSELPQEVQDAFPGGAPDVDTAG